MALSNPEKIALLTDSTADLTAGMRAGKPIYTVPLKIICPDGEFSDGVDIFAQDVYDRLHRGELPRTSLPEGGAVSDALDRIRADGYEKVIALMLSGGLSGTYNMVRLLAEQREDLEVVAFDSKSGSLGLGIMVLQLWEEIQAGADWDTLISQRVPFLVEHTFPFFSVDTLEYLYKGGRIGKVAAMAGTMLQIKPIITFADDGQLQSVAKVRGRRQDQDKIVDLMLYGPATSRQCYIISERSDELRRAIVNQLGSGGTLLEGKGAWSGQDKQVILCVIRPRQITALRRLVRTTDQKAFFIISDARCVYGKGFESLEDDD